MPEYRVTGPFPFRGHEPGSTFDTDLSDQIERAVNRGSISPAPSKPASTPTGGPDKAPPQTNTTPTPPPAAAAGNVGLKSKEDTK